MMMMMMMIYEPQGRWCKWAINSTVQCDYDGEGVAEPVWLYKGPAIFMVVGD